MCWFCIYLFFSQNKSFFIKLIIFILLVHGRNPSNLYPPTNIRKWNSTISKMSETWESPIIQIFPTHFRFCRIRTKNFVFVKPTPDISIFCEFPDPWISNIWEFLHRKNYVCQDKTPIWNEKYVWWRKLVSF